MLTRATVARRAQLITQREAVSGRIRQELIERARSFHLILDDVSITHLSFGKEYTAAVESKQVAQQDAERARFIVDKAVQEKKSMVIKAEGEAKSAKLIGDAIRDNPGFIQLRKLEAAREIASTLCAPPPADTRHPPTHRPPTAQPLRKSCPRGGGAAGSAAAAVAGAQFQSRAASSTHPVTLPRTRQVQVEQQALPRRRVAAAQRQRSRSGRPVQQGQPAGDQGGGPRRLGALAAAPANELGAWQRLRASPRPAVSWMAAILAPSAAEAETTRGAGTLCRECPKPADPSRRPSAREERPYTAVCRAWLRVCMRGPTGSLRDAPLARARAGD